MFSKDTGTPNLRKTPLLFLGKFVMGHTLEEAEQSFQQSSILTEQYASKVSSDRAKKICILFSMDPTGSTVISGEGTFIQAAHMLC